MKIAFLAAANSIHSIRWIKYFSDKGHEIIWVSLAPPTAEAAELIKKVDFYEIKPSPLKDINGKWAFIYFPWAILKLMEILRKTRPDVLHIHSAGTYGLVGALSFFKQIILTPWGSDVLLSSPVKKILIKLTVLSADACTCDGENTFNKLVELGAEPEKIKIIRFGTDVEKFRPANNNGQKTKSKSAKIISLRNLIPVYDIETLIRAAAIVVKESAGWRTKTEFIIAGDGEQREYLEQMANGLGLMANGAVKFIGKIKNDDLPTLLQSADIYVSTSLSDSGLSASTAEAMASGLPVIVSDSGDNKKWVADGSTGLPQAGGFVIPCGDYKTLAEKLIYLLKNPAKRKSFGKHDRKIIEEKNNYYIEMDKVEKLYEKIVAPN